MRVVDESLSVSSARRECGLVAGDQSAARFARVVIPSAEHRALRRTAARPRGPPTIPPINQINQSPTTEF